MRKSDLGRGVGKWGCLLLEWGSWCEWDVGMAGFGSIGGVR